MCDASLGRNKTLGPWHPDSVPISVAGLVLELRLSRFLPFLATEYHLGLLKAKLAKYRAQLLEPSKAAAGKGEGFDVMKSGDARVALIGFPSVGKVSECWRISVLLLVATSLPPNSTFLEF